MPGGVRPQDRALQSSLPQTILVYNSPPALSTPGRGLLACSYPLLGTSEGRNVKAQFLMAIGPRRFVEHHGSVPELGPREAHVCHEWKPADHVVGTGVREGVAACASSI